MQFAVFFPMALRQLGSEWSLTCPNNQGPAGGDEEAPQSQKGNTETSWGQLKGLGIAQGELA